MPPRSAKTALLAVTCGEPAGIASEITVKAWHACRALPNVAFFVLADPDVMQQQASHLGLDCPLRTIADPADAIDAFADALPVLPVSLPVTPRFGQPAPANAPAIVASIDHALAFCRDGRVDGMVTNPIQKSTLYDAGFTHGGHTEYLGHRCGLEHPPLMMLTAQDLRVIPLTIHIPLREVSARLTTASVIDTATRLHDALRSDFAIATPRLALAALNPHAGEHGHIGREEIDILQPAATRLRAHGITITDPLPADTLFHADARRQYDAVLCLYHDQALIPLKTIDFWGGVNVTLGLPIVRTSPDHGTGLAIADQGIARADSLINALQLAATIAARRHAG